MFQRAEKSEDHASHTDEPAAIPHSGGGEVPFRADMEHSFGQDFSSVRAHLGQSEAMGALGAHAAASGESISFASASPDRELVAHELAHVVQHRQSGGGGVHAKSIAPSDSGAEVEADAVAPRAAAGERVQIHASLGAGIHLKRWEKNDKVQHTQGTGVVTKVLKAKKPPPSDDDVEYRVRFTGKKLSTKVKGKELTDVGPNPKQQKLGVLNQHIAAKKHERGSAEADDGDYGELVDQGAEGFGTAGESLDSVAGYMQDNGNDSQATQGAQIGIGAGGVGSGTAAIGGVVGLVGFVKNIHSFKTTWAQGADKRLEWFLDLTGNTTQMVGGAGITAAGVGGTVASAVDYASDSGSTRDAMMAFGGIGAGIDAIANAVLMLRDGAATTVGVVNGIRNWNKEETDWSKVGGDALATLEDAMRFAMSAVSAIDGFLELVDKAGELAAVMPVLGAAVNIFLRLISLARALIDGIVRTVKLVKLGIATYKMNKGKKQATTAEEKQLHQVVGGVNVKRIKRQVMLLITKDIIPFCTSIASITGSVLEIVGVATSPAYGAGVGLMAAGAGLRGGSALLNFGAAMTPHVAKLWRTQKQFGRDVRAGERDGKMAKVYQTMHFDKMFSKTKSSDQKLDEYLTAIENLFEVVDKLPAHSTANQKQYDHVHDIVCATGVDTKKLYTAADERTAVRLLLDALQQRE